MKTTVHEFARNVASVTAVACFVAMLVLWGDALGNLTGF